MGLTNVNIPNDKHESSRFGGEGQCFKAKLIGILEVSEARGDRMCQEALSDLKMAIRAAGEHKQRITVHIALDGLRLRDEKSGDCLYHHPVHKISFIAQDMTDSRAFGYIFGSPDTGHRFFGIKTDKAASQVVIAMRDLFQVVFALKKKEIELAKLHLEKNCLYNSPLFSDSSSNKSVTPELPAKYEAAKNEGKTASSSTESKVGGTAVANLVDLQLELNSLQQGLHQMEKITPSDPFGSKDDPFGDSFTAFPNPILPPPPSLGKERSSRTSDCNSIFSPKTPHICENFTAACGIDSYPFASLPKTEFKFSRDFSTSHEEASSGEWFTPSNSLLEESSESTQKVLDEKEDKLERTKKEILSQFDVFTELDPLELKNPPKKALNELVTQIENQNIVGSKDTSANVVTTPKSTSGFESDPFDEDPFVSLDPFAETIFKQDPFGNGFNDFKKNTEMGEAVLTLLSTNLSKSPNSTTLAGMSLSSISPKNVKFTDSLNKDDNESKMETAPEPPPRPDIAILPPPLPPKKQVNDIIVKPPPRPPHVEESIYVYLDTYESDSNNLESADKGPALPIPMRKCKFENDFALAPERPAKQTVSHSFEDDYLTPIQFPKQSDACSILLPPTSMSSSKHSSNTQNVPTSSLNTQVNGTANLDVSFKNSLDGLDITLSQLTLSGLNELAAKLNIPTSELSNMTLVQLTAYLSNVIKSQSGRDNITLDKKKQNTLQEFPAFKADFESNFTNAQTTNNETFDRYAVFRELINEEIKQNKIVAEVEVTEDCKNEVAEMPSPDSVPTAKVLVNETAEDRYAALREIAERDLLKKEIKIIEEKEHVNIDGSNVNPDFEMESKKIMEKQNSIIENKLNEESNRITDKSYIDYDKKVEGEKDDILMKPAKSPAKIGAKSPIPSAITEILQSNVRLNSGSLSDIVSGSSPEVDNTISNSEVVHKTEDITGESWAIFDHGNMQQESPREKQATQSEEGLSPWSSDSKDGNGSPSDYRRGDSESGADNWTRRIGHRNQDGWWDTSAEPEVPYSSSNRRSTDSFEDEYYECYDKPRRRKQGGWGGHGGSQATGGHSSSSRDASPWEEEPKRRDPRDVRGNERIGWSRSSKQQFDRHRERRPTDSWDEEDDYEFGDSRRFHRDKYSGRESDRHGTGSRENDSEIRERWSEEWMDERRRRRRRENDREYWCCPDWKEEEHEKLPARYGSSGRWPNAGTPPGKWRERKHDGRYYNRDESPWEDEYPLKNEDMHSSHYITSKRNWKRPNSASEMERKTGEFKSRHLGGSDGERDRRYKGSRRSRSRDSQYSEPSYRHKPDTSSLTRNSYKNKTHGQYTKPQFESEFSDVSGKKQLDNCHLDLSNKKSFTLQSRKKKDSPSNEENMNTLPRKSTKPKQSFENSFQSELRNIKCDFEKEFQIEPEPAIIAKTAKLKQQQSLIEIQRKSPREIKSRNYQNRSKSLFEDDFSVEKAEHPSEDNGISVIKEEVSEENDSFNVCNFEQATNTNRLSKRLSGGLRTDLKKSESINIFARESDPFDDDFFCETACNVDLFDNTSDTKELRNSDHEWTDNYNS
ncbi:hypothetical protein WA026_011729 [Henosepilachna vigintioctopunctata]|uniref:PID domain-containing protein n=3 Tax=Henosepilachna vigintioctopunctata TaxID=420089 RepID=A0AAW1UM52_9CUCU